MRWTGGALTYAAAIAVRRKRRVQLALRRFEPLRVLFPRIVHTCLPVPLRGITQTVHEFHPTISLFTYDSLPQMADFNTPQAMDAAGEC